MAEKSGGTTDHVTADSSYNEARCSGARLYTKLVRPHYCLSVRLHPFNIQDNDLGATQYLHSSTVEMAKNKRKTDASGASGTKATVLRECRPPLRPHLPGPQINTKESYCMIRKKPPPLKKLPPTDSNPLLVVLMFNNRIVKYLVQAGYT